MLCRVHGATMNKIMEIRRRVPQNHGKEAKVTEVGRSQNERVVESCSRILPADDNVSN